MRRIVLGLVLLTVGCTTTKKDVDDVPTVVTTVPRGIGAISVVNETERVIYRVLLADASDVEWGPDRLDGAEVLKPGNQRSFEVSEGVYSVQVEFKGGKIYESGEHYTVRADEETFCKIRDPEDDQLGTLTIVNETGWAISSVYFSSTNEMGWGEERLTGPNVLAPRKQVSWKVPAGKYNLKVEFQDGTSLEGEGAYEVVAGTTSVYRLGS